ncbi:MAG: sigma-70 family RNA polymerase sigma factor [Bacteroidia bacterium]|nr:sigma-70 family RNA polymerase sigma factor [Bacteroidia bacterium]
MISAEHQRNIMVFEKEFFPQINALYNFAYHLTFSEEDSNDLVQETYLKAYKNIDKYEKGTNAKAWLFRILKNAFINEYRKKVNRPKKVDFDDIVKYQDGESEQLLYEDFRQEIYQNLIGDEVTSAVNALGIEFRTVILLCDVEGFTYEEIAKIVDIPIGTVRSRLHRARNMLKKRLYQYAHKIGYKDKRSSG